MIDLLFQLRNILLVKTVLNNKQYRGFKLATKSSV